MKRKLFWILYFGISAAAIVLAAVLMPQYVVFNWYSLFPIAYIICVILLALFFPSKLNARFAIWYEERSRIKWGNLPLDAPFFEEDELVKMDYDLHVCLSKTFLLFLPFWMPFVIFGLHIAKILSFLIILAPIVLSFYFTIRDIAKEDEIHAQLEKERKEQEQREELGRWK